MSIPRSTSYIGGNDGHDWHTQSQPVADTRMSRDGLDRPLEVAPGGASVVPGRIPMNRGQSDRFGGPAVPLAIADGPVAVVPKAIIVDGANPSVIALDTLQEEEYPRQRQTRTELHDQKQEKDHLEDHKSKQVAMKPTEEQRLQYPLFHDQIEEGHYRNPWFRFRSRFRIYLAEYLGTLVLVLWGEGTQAQVVVARGQPNDYLSIAWGWGIGFMLAIYISSGISGGHVNPAVTFSLAIFRKFPWRQVPGYFAAQVLGAFTAACIIYGVYYDVLSAVPGSFAGVLITGPASLVPTLSATFFSVFIGAALLMLAICAFTDTGNNPATPGLTPLLLGLIMVGIASSFGYQTGFVLNPARDFGPRLLMYATGQGGRELWLANEAYGIWVPLVATCTGAAVGNAFYDFLIYNGRDSPVNTNFSRRGRKYVKRERTASVTNGQGNNGMSGAGAGVTPTPSDMESGRLSGVTVMDDRSPTTSKLGNSPPPVGVV